MTCQDCGRTHPTTQPSLEFDAIVCDGCYGSRLATEAARRERTVSANTRDHLDAIRAARATVGL